MNTAKTVNRGAKNQYLPLKITSQPKEGTVDGVLSKPSNDAESRGGSKMDQVVNKPRFSSEKVAGPDAWGEPAQRKSRRLASHPPGGKR